jgi:hypothetical protein
MTVDPASSPKPVTPRPGMLRTIGFLNIFLGGMLFFISLMPLHWIAPSILRLESLKVDADSIEDARRYYIEILHISEDRAKRAPEKAKIREQIRIFETHKVAGQLDYDRLNQNLRWLTFYGWIDITTAPVLNLLMLASGLGLFKLMRWARSLAIWVMALKLVRLVLLFALLIFVVVPRVSATSEALSKTDLGRALIAPLIAEQNARQGGGMPVAQVGPVDLAQVMKATGYVISFLFLCLSAIYPAVALTILLQPGARAAVELAEEPDGEDERD